ncbi:helix-turn-helix domain-containing protein [Chryseobacterium tructae]|uniref:Helix-turn-helix domain-containing protein n=2 Tax=Chryseobacterium tructae TaxID=1037380 RepID=A0ABV7XV36_9FLAO
MGKYQRPDFRQIYLDIITSKHPDKYDQCKDLLEKRELFVMDILKINMFIFSSSEKNSQKYRAYQKSDILQILDFQKKNKINNTQLAAHFKMSRNTITRWKKIYYSNEC